MIDSTVTRSSTVSDIVRRSGVRFGDKVAVRFADREWTTGSSTPRSPASRTI